MSAKSDGPSLLPPPEVPDPSPDLGEVLWSNAFLDRPRIRPNDGTGTTAVGVMADPAVPLSLIGIAYPYAHIGGVRWDMAPEDLADAPPPEVVWRLVLDRAWVGGRAVPLKDKRSLDGRFVLRSGRFVELAEEAL